MERIVQTLRTNLYLFVWLFLTVFFVGSLFFAYFMDWQDERLVVLLAGAVGASLQSIAMLTSTTAKGGNRLGDIPGALEDATVVSTRTIETKSEERSVEPEKPKEETR